MARHRGVGCSRTRSGGGDRLSLPHEALDSPPRPARTLPELELHHHQHLDSPRVRGDLRRGLRDGDISPGHRPLPWLQVWPGSPGFLLLGLFSERFGVFAGRYGPRRFMVMGPAVMALGILWLGRFPLNSQAWRMVAGDPSSWLPPTSYLTDVLPSMLIYGFGLTMLVAPLTTALDGVGPGGARRAGFGNQQRRVPGGTTTGRSRHFHRHHGGLLHPDGGCGSRHGCRQPRGAGNRWRRSTRRPTMWRPTSPQHPQPLPPTHSEWRCGSRPWG